MKLRTKPNLNKEKVREKKITAIHHTYFTNVRVPIRAASKVNNRLGVFFWSGSGNTALDIITLVPTK